ncbi:DapH/DapD/GlmU-related protein [Mucilaginibacter sp. RCC_168]|uniref:acyltransferase n=1 Tax=Mucilaginibacter sp. RCC_168 TaxID=3239221 RepID=UPI00352573FB
MKKIKLIISEFRLYTANYIISGFPSHNFRLFFYKKIMRFEIGKNTFIFMKCTFDSTLNLKIGSNAVVGARCRLDTRGMIEIGSNVSISQDVIILTADHEMNSIDFSGRVRHVTIEDYAWIGTRAMILPGVTVGKGAVIAAGSVVSKNVEAFSVVGGIPAKKIGERSANLQYDLHYKRLFQ